MRKLSDIDRRIAGLAALRADLARRLDKQADGRPLACTALPTAAPGGTTRIARQRR